MNRTAFRARGPFFGLLAVALVALPVLSADKPALAPAPRPVLPPPPSTIPASYIKPMTWRCVGPANMGGRITAIAVVESDPNTYFVATASGGLIKTVNNGTTFEMLFDKEATVSIGDVAVAQSDPKIVWVGTGENNPRNSVSYGDGVYKSTDGGKTWINMGLKKSFQIGKIVIHPKDPNTVYVGALGRLYGPNEERGLFKTTDGGKSWKKVLYVDDRTGVIDFRMDPFDPETLIVGMWERKRDEFDGFFGPAASWPTQDQYGPAVGQGPGGGLFKTADGGTHWKKLTGADAASGLPTVKTGRIGLDYSRKTKGLVYAIIDTERIGYGRPLVTVYVGLSTEDQKGNLKVTAAPDDGPAGKAGVKEGDIIVKMDAKKIAKYDEFHHYLATKKPGEQLKIGVKRGGKELTIDVKLAPREEPPAKKKNDPKTPPPILGVQIESEDDGIGIEAITPDGPADKAGLKKGNLITAVNGKKVTDQETLRTVLGSFKPGDKVKVTVGRGKKSRQVELTLGAGQIRKGGGNRAAPNPQRPYLISPQVGGQRPNIQDEQGLEGFQTGGIYVSRDNGDHWTRVNSLNARPFYFSQIRVDPNDDSLIYAAGDTTLWKSTNGGKKFESQRAREVHPDHHALWIDPRDSRHMLLGCDGGFYVTYDRGAAWDHMNVLPLGQFYHVAVDNRKPYRVFGGLQDNGSWVGPSHVLRSVGPVNDDWGTILGGDGFVCRVDPTDSDLVYAESQNGNIMRHNLRTGDRGGFGPGTPKQGETPRKNWNTPFILSNHNPGIVYAASQYVSRSVKQGGNLKVISPEITRTKKGSGTALCESPRTPDVLWAGTDDGYLWVTRDGGAKWTNVYDKLKAAGLPGPFWISSIEASKAKDGRCYVALDAHRSNDDRPFFYATEDYGQTWQPIASNLPAFGSARVLREDIVNPDILYAGTEFGVWVTVNRGATWTKLNNNLPTVAVHEVAQPASDSEIVVATHGRSLWILDVASLRQMAQRTEGNKAIDPLKEPVTLFAPAPAVRWKLRADLQESIYSRNVRKFYGTNPDRRAAIDYALTKPAKSLSLKLLDASGKLVWDFRNAAKDAGFHRQMWSLNRAGGGNLAVPAGTYRIVLNIDGKEFNQGITVENDPHADPKAQIAVETERTLTEEEEEEREREGWDDED
ncbi:MAG TPA: PDZ domain-containing protein [Urbifossiella sp.]|nr:PDZ domain-containing protein [Urbifossiella sp.]